mgnify:CR=1 FL=1
MSQTIKTTLDAFIVAVVNSYTEVIREDIPDEKFEKIVEEVQVARDKAVDLLSTLLRQEVVRAVERHPAVLAKKLTPSDIGPQPTNRVMEPQPSKTLIPPGATMPVAPPMAAPGNSPLPRDVSESVDPYMNGIPDTPPPAAPTSGGMFADDFSDPMEGVDHTPPVMTVEEQKRMEAGLPRRPYRPHIHHDGNTPREIPLNADLAAKNEKAVIGSKEETP